MTKDVKALMKERLQAQIEKEKLEAKKLEVEIETLETAQAGVPFYKSETLLKPVFAGISISLIVAGYVQYIFIPTQNIQIKKVESAELRLNEAKAEHANKLSHMDLMKAKLELVAKENEVKLTGALASLNEAKAQNTRLLAILSNKNDDLSGESKELQDELKASQTAIENKIAAVQESRVEVDGLLTLANEAEASRVIPKGWIYLGYYPNKKWGYRTLKVDDKEEVIDNKTYELRQNVNLRDQSPKFSLVGYEFGKVLEVVRPPMKVKILKKETVGFSKVWAYVEFQP